MKSLFRRTMLVGSLLLSAAVLAVWVRSYSVADRYRWIHIDSADNGSAAVMRGGFVITGLGGLYISGGYERTTEPLRIFAMKRRQQMIAQSNRGGYASIRPPRYPMPAVEQETGWTSLGFAWFYLPEESDQTYRVRMSLTFPLWLIFALTMAYPMGLYVSGVIRRQREERMDLGLCPRCGSVLSDGSPRCPGCDHPVPAGLARHA